MNRTKFKWNKMQFKNSKFLNIYLENEEDLKMLAKLLCFKPQEKNINIYNKFTIVHSFYSS